MTRKDRPAAIRAATRRLVAERGFHGAPMGAIAELAGVATGTAYVHYPSKDELLFAVYLEIKHDLGTAATAAIDATAPPAARFRQLWEGARRHLLADPERAAFLVQFDASPYAAEGHRRALAVSDDPLVAEAATGDLASRLAPLPPLVLYDLSLGALVRSVARGEQLDDVAAVALADAAWRAITTPPSPSGH